MLRCALCALLLLGSLPGPAAVKWRVQLSTAMPQPQEPARHSTPIQVVDWREWQHLKAQHQASDAPQLMLIVDTKASDVPESEFSLEEEQAAEPSSSSTAAPPSSTAPPAEQTTEAAENGTRAEGDKKQPDLTIDVKNLPAILNILKHLSLIPAVVRSFTAGSAGAGPLSGLFPAPAEVRYSPEGGLRSRAVSAESGYGPPAAAFVTAPPEEPAALPKNSIPNMPAPIVPVNGHTFRPRELAATLGRQFNIYGLEPRPTKEPKAFEAPLDHTHRPRPQFDFSRLTEEDVEKLEKIHQKLFSSAAPLKIAPIPSTSTEAPAPTSPLFVFDKPRDVSQAEHVHNDVLTPEMVKELELVRDMPDLEELTKGMDLSLLSKPGGFAKLKQDFMERLVDRTLQARRRFVHRMN